MAENKDIDWNFPKIAGVVLIDKKKGGKGGKKGSELWFLS